MKEGVLIKDVFAVTDRGKPEEQKGWWTRIGVAFENRDESMNVILDALPLNGRLHIRRRDKKKTD